MGHPGVRKLQYLNPPDLVGVAEIAEKASVSTSAVVNWITRHEDFPKPIVVLASGRVFLWTEVQRWLVATGRTDKKEK